MAKGADGSYQIDPIKQFEIRTWIELPRIFGLDISFTNSAFWMVVGVVLSAGLFMLGMRHRAMVPGRLQMLVEMLYEFIANMVQSYGGREAMRYLPFVLAVFMFVLMGNVLGLVPAMDLSFTYTSHIIVTFALAMVVFLMVTGLGFARHGLHFGSVFVPAGVPLLLLPLLVPIEIISYLSRPISLSIRLFANMMAGHAMMKVFASFTIMMGVAGFVPLAVNTALVGFELLVALLQAFVFAVLTCIYLRDAIYLHH